ncbi:MAG: twin-arginine translocase subunit TatC [Halobacteriales archaeon]|nr:twin-arginine translocase subunit TatC [Halobacteriales archaeon]
MAAGDIVDEDTRESLAAGRRTFGDMLVAARSKLRRVFIVFVIGLLATIYALRVWIWPQLKRDLLAQGASVVVITPFDVILLQAKIGILVGIILSIPFFIYYSRDPLKDRGWWPKEGVADWKLASLGGLAFVLFLGGVTYSYQLFFPIMFSFLANNAISAGFSPTYSIVDWTQFILVLSLSFGLAAQLPLVMTVLSYTGIVPYETFRDKWKYAIVIMFGFGAMFSPPDPFTQLMWALPLVGLYAFSLYLARLATAARREDTIRQVRQNLRTNIGNLAGAFVLIAGVVTWALLNGAIETFNRAVRPQIPGMIRPQPVTLDAIAPAGGVVGAAILGGVLGLAVVVVLVVYYSWPSFDNAPRSPADFGEPAAIDLESLDAAGVRAAPPEVFAEMDENDALMAANEAMDADHPEKARAILDRFDAVQEMSDAETEAAETADTAAATGAEAGTDPETAGGGFESAAANIATAMTDEETTEEDIGGYYTDIMFILDSLRSRAFRIFAVFIGVLVAVFSFLYGGGIGFIKRDFIARLPASVQPEEVSIVTLHPVEALVFEVKISTLLGAVSTLPFLLYYAWPSLKERGLVSGDRNVFFTWGASVLAGLLIGSAIGYLYIAPAVVSYLVWDALQANMIIAYRVSNFFWLVFFTTVGIGLWVDIPVTMFLFHRGRIVTYRSMRRRWREVTLAVLVFAALFTPSTVLSMVLVTIPIMLAYGFGLGILWLYTFGGRRSPQPAARSG